MKRILAILLPLALAAPAPAGEREHDRVRRAVEAGQVLPLRTILDRVEKEQPGQLLEAELEHEHGRLVYELKLLTPEGRVVERLFDAATGEPLAERERRR